MSQVKKGFNMAVEDLEIGIMKFMNESKLPMSVCKMVSDRVSANVGNQLSAVIAKEREEFNSDHKEQKNDSKAGEA